VNDGVKGCGGPTSVQGKLRVSSNPTKHGLTGFGLVLPGESASAYRRNQLHWLQALNAGDQVTGQVAGQLADIAWRLDRCSRLEHQYLRVAVEKQMMKEPQFKSFSLAHRALIAVNALAENAAIAAGTSGSLSQPALDALLSGSRGVVTIVGEVDGLPLAVLERLRSSVSELARSADGEPNASERMTAIAKAARAVARVLKGHVRSGEQSLDGLREKVAAAALVSDDKVLRKFGRYRRDLETSQMRLLGVMEQLRKQVDAAGKAPSLDPVRLRLRVVR
jgi:hypothetical protein